MSHLTTYKSEVLVNCKKSLLKKAVSDLGLELNDNIKQIKNTWITDTVDAGLVKNGKAVAVGLQFKKEGRNTKVIVAGDFYGTGIDQRTFINQLSQQYKKHDVIYQCKKQGWTINTKDVTIDSKTDEIVINASRFVA